MAQNYNDTIHKMQTPFEMRAGLPKKEPKMLEDWEQNHVYEQMIKNNEGKPQYILHDGPPYANGNIHMGTALNKIIKDIIIRYKNMSGFQAPYVPGYDTHGLPIELKALSSLGDKKAGVSKLELRQICKEFATEHIGVMNEQFKRLGVQGDFENPYLTLRPEFEARQVEIFGEMAKKGYIYKGMKAVYWCPEDRTALAEAEIEYAEDECDSIYVRFKLTDDPNGVLAKHNIPLDKAWIVIWTTTTWTLPANVATCLNPNLEYACASGMSWLALDSKGDLARNYGTIAKNCYGYNVSVIDLRNPTRSDGNNLLTLVNRYMDIARKDPKNLAARAKAEKYAKILAKTIVNPDGDDSNRGQNAFFYDAAEGLLTSVILILAEFLPPDKEHPQERRHIVSVFKLVQDLLEPSKVKGKSHFQLLIGKLPPDHKARWFAGAALNSAEQAMASVMSTVLSRLNAFLDSELEQVLCFDSAINAEKFGSEKSAIFLILPEEDTTKNFMAGLMIQNLSRELFAVADENGGKLQNRVVLYCDEFGTMPPFDVLPLFSAGRSRRLTLVPIIQSLAQLEKNYGKEGSEIIQDNCQDTIFGGFAPNSQTAEQLSKALGSRTVLSGSISRSKNDPSQSLQMIERPLMTPDELKSIPKGSFVVMKTGTHPMQTKLRLFLDWGITFGAPYITPEHAARPVAYASRQELFLRIDQAYGKKNSQPTQVPVAERRSPYSAMGLYNEDAKT